MWGRGRPGLVCCASRCGCQLQTLPSWETQQWEPGAWPPASIQDYLGPCRVGGSVILSGTSHCVCMAVTSRGLAGLLPGPGNLALSLPDERDRVQKKTFTKWVNKHLIKVGGVRARGCERLCRSACVCVCVCARVRRVSGVEEDALAVWPKQGLEPALYLRGRACFLPRDPPPTSEPVLSVCFLPWLAHLLSLFSSSSSLLISVALEGRGRCLLGGGRLLWAPCLEPSGPAPHSVPAGSEAHQ